MRAARTIAAGVLVLVALGATFGACSAKPISSARVDGTVAKVGLAARTAIAHGALGLGIQVEISDKLNTCNVDHALGAVELILTFPGNSIAANTYDAGNAPGGQVEADFRVLNATCTETILRRGTGGTVTVTSTSGPTMTGSFDLLFDQDHIGGEFSALLCPDALGEAGLPFGSNSAAAPSASSPFDRLDGSVVGDPEAGVLGDVGDASTSGSSNCLP
jgi:hypothetical protein